jgi:hypothetical protein
MVCRHSIHRPSFIHIHNDVGRRTKRLCPALEPFSCLNDSDIRIWLSFPFNNFPAHVYVYCWQWFAASGQPDLTFSCHPPISAYPLSDTATPASTRYPFGFFCQLTTASHRAYGWGMSADSAGACVRIRIPRSSAIPCPVPHSGFAGRYMCHVQKAVARIQARTFSWQPRVCGRFSLPFSTLYSQDQVIAGSDTLEQIDISYQLINKHPDTRSWSPPQIHHLLF